MMVLDRNHPRPPSEMESVEQRTEDGAGGVSDHPLASLEHRMSRYQQADPAAPGALIASLSPALLRFFRYNSASREQAQSAAKVGRTPGSARVPLDPLFSDEHRCRQTGLGSAQSAPQPTIENAPAAAALLE